MYEFLPIGYMLRGRYRILRVIGGGGMGAIYKAEDGKNNNVAVAVKEMRTDVEHHSRPAVPSDEDAQREKEERRQLLEAFRREAQMLSDLIHPNLPQVTDFFTEGGRPYLVMELIPGESLEKRLDRMRGKPLDEEEVLQYGIQVCRVLHFLHTQNPPVIFRDVKPANIMVMPNNQIKLIDFGIARTYKEGKRRDTMSMGTAAYAPFEQFGKGQTDARSDVYSLAATLYHLLTGRPPTPATTPTTLRDYNPHLSEATEKLIIRAMSRDMNARPQSATALEEELVRCLGRPYEAPSVQMSDLAAPAHISGPRLSSTPLPAPSTPSPIRPIQPLAAAPAGPASQGSGGAQVHASAYAPAPAPVPGTAGSVAHGTTPPTAPYPQVAQPAEGRTCMVCNTTNKPHAHFCGHCGASLAGRPPGKLQVLGPNGVLWERPIRENPFIIGRRSLSRQIFPHLDLTYNDPAAYVSRQHARIIADAGGYFIEDLGSANGSFLNDRRLPGGVPTRLRNGDRVRIGKVQLNFILGS